MVGVSTPLKLTTAFAYKIAEQSNNSNFLTIFPLPLLLLQYNSPPLQGCSSNW